MYHMTIMAFLIPEVLYVPLNDRRRIRNDTYALIILISIAFLVLDVYSKMRRTPVGIIAFFNIPLEDFLHEGTKR